LDQLLPVGGALQQHFLDAEQFRLRPLGARLDDHHVVHPDAFPLHQLGGADRDFQAWIVLGDLRYRPTADFLVHAAIETHSRDRSGDGRQRHGPLETEPAAVDRPGENGKNLPWLGSRVQGSGFSDLNPEP
jgi:hypothetical protein